jgi:hypothetical protein
MRHFSIARCSASAVLLIVLASGCGESADVSNSQGGNADPSGGGGGSTAVGGSGGVVGGSGGGSANGGSGGAIGGSGGSSVGSGGSTVLPQNDASVTPADGAAPSDGSTKDSVMGADDLVAFAGPVKLSDATVDFRHQPYTLDANNGLVSFGGQAVTTRFDVKVIENDLVKVTVLPSFGARILSIIYKPTNQEMLYQNSLGVPYGKGSGDFYYDWLMVYGGIFPTFSEPEHGKMWLLPWTVAVVTSTDDEVAIRMNKKDDISPAGGIPPQKFKYGRTDLDVTATVRVVRGSSAVGLDVEVANTRATPVSYEYWTCTTMTPGSTPGKTASPANTEMVTPVDRVFIEPRWGWMRSLETPTTETDVYTYNKLASFSSWSGMGIAYAYPTVTKPWWGVLNRDNKVGIFRVADPAATPGLKYWTWGAGSVGVNPDSASTSRPYIELWAGHSQRFFTPAQLAANAKKQWTERYLPTIGLTKFSEVTEGAAAYLSYTVNAASTAFQADLFTSLPSRRLKVRLSVEGATSKILLDQDWAPDATKSTTLTVSVPAGQMPSGAARYVIVIQKATGEQVLRAEVPLK